MRRVMLEESGVPEIERDDYFGHTHSKGVA
jgi:hypothetical protein